MPNLKSYAARCDVEHEEAWLGWVNKIPYLTFKSKWEVQVLPPFSGDMVRFRIRYKEKTISVYLDCYGRLGQYSRQTEAPYWEAYPIEHSTFRVALNDTDSLIAAIDKELGD